MNENALDGNALLDQHVKKYTRKAVGVTFVLCVVSHDLFVIANHDPQNKLA